MRSLAGKAAARLLLRERTFPGRAMGHRSINSTASHELTRDDNRMDLLVRIGLRPRRSALGVVPELAELLRAAAGFGDLRGPLDGRFARREFQDTEAAVELL